MNIEYFRTTAKKSPCKVIKFAASDGNLFSYNGEFYSYCDKCKRTEIEQSHPDCLASHAEWGIFARSKQINDLYIYCMTPDGKDYPFTRLWCKVCSILIPMLNVKNVYMWNGIWVWHDPLLLINE
jgi:hypothetical protein